MGAIDYVQLRMTGWEVAEAVEALAPAWGLAVFSPVGVRFTTGAELRDAESPDGHELAFEASGQACAAVGTDAILAGLAGLGGVRWIRLDLCRDVEGNHRPVGNERVGAYRSCIRVEDSAGGWSCTWGRRGKAGSGHQFAVYAKGAQFKLGRDVTRVELRLWRAHAEAAFRSLTTDFVSPADEIDAIIRGLAVYGADGSEPPWWRELTGRGRAAEVYVPPKRKGAARRAWLERSVRPCLIRAASEDPAWYAEYLAEIERAVDLPPVSVATGGRSRVNGATPVEGSV